MEASIPQEQREGATALELEEGTNVQPSLMARLAAGHHNIRSARLKHRKYLEGIDSL